MAVNVLDSIEQLFNEPAINSIAEAIGASREAVDAAIRPALATVIETVVSRTETPDGAEYVFRTVSDFGGSVHGNFNETVATGAYADVSEVGRRVAKSLLGDDEEECIEQVSCLAGLSPDQGKSVLHTVAGLVFDLAGEERSRNSQNRTGVVKFFEAQRTLLRAELPTHILESVGLIEGSYDEDSFELVNFAPMSDEGFVPPLQSSTHNDEALTATASASTTTTVFDDDSDDIGGVDATTNLGLGGVLLEEDEPARVRDEVADALSPNRSQGPFFLPEDDEPEETEPLDNQKNQLQVRELDSNGEPVLSDRETTAFYLKSLFALATLATLWFTLLNYRARQIEREAQQTSTEIASLQGEQAESGQANGEEGSTSELTQQSPNTTTIGTSVTTKVRRKEEDPLTYFAINSTPSKIETAKEITPADSADRLITIELTRDREISSFASVPHQAGVIDQPETRTIVERATWIERDSPRIDLTPYAAPAAQVRFELRPTAINQTPGIVGYKIIDSLRIPVFEAARPTRKSYYTQ